MIRLQIPQQQAQLSQVRREHNLLIRPVSLLCKISHSLQHHLGLEYILSTDFGTLIASVRDTVGLYFLVVMVEEDDVGLEAA